MDLVAAAHDSKEWLNMVCPICGVKFHLKPYAVKKDKHHYCSKKCHYLAKQQYTKGEKNHQYGLRGNKNASWKGGKKLDLGYYWVYRPDHPFSVGKTGYVLEHRIVAEKYLLNDENSVVIDGKRYLARDWIVHHKNGVRTDNRPENLEVMKKGEHTSIHNKINDVNRARTPDGRYAPKSSSGR